LQSIKVEQNNVIAKEILNRLHRKTFSSTAFCAIKGRSKKPKRKNRETEKTENSIEELKTDLDEKSEKPSDGRTSQRPSALRKPVEVLKDVRAAIFIPFLCF
jgi:translation elongation factor EF-Tu-like GTPase